MKLDNFELEYYNKENIEHRSVLTLIGNQEISQKFLGTIDLLVSNTEKRFLENFVDSFYIAYYNDEPVGFITINLIDNKYEISSGILPKFQKQHLGPLLLQEFSEKIFEKYKNIDKLYLQINQANIGAQKSAQLAGYEHEVGTRYSMKR